MMHSELCGNSTEGRSLLLAQILQNSFIWLVALPHNIFTEKLTS